MKREFPLAKLRLTYQVAEHEWRGNRHPKDVARDARSMWESSDRLFQEAQLRMAEQCWKPVEANS